MMKFNGMATALALVLAGCGADHGDDGSGTGGPGSETGSETGSKGGASGSGGSAGFDFKLPDRVEGPDDGQGSPVEGKDCEPNFTGIVRDFRDAHSDFQAYSGNGASPGIVESMLGADRKPVYSRMGQFVDPKNGPQVTSKETFDQWYRDVEGENMRFQHVLDLKPLANGVLSFDSEAFFPIDGRGFGDFRDSGHNFHFTFELHTEFAYNGGEEFTFRGDDDLWVFINGRLALDLGGLHPRLEGKVTLDEIAKEFGLKVGTTYPLDLFHAERRTGQSNFRVDTTIKFTNCNPILVL